MVNIRIDFANTCGPIKAMNGVNNGPLASSVRKTSAGFALYKELEIPYARLHDSAFQEVYGGEYSVDVHRVFHNFDVGKPASDSTRICLPPAILRLSPQNNNQEIFI